MFRQLLTVALIVWCSLQVLASLSQEASDAPNIVTMRVVLPQTGDDLRFYRPPQSIEVRLALVNGSLTPLLVDAKHLRSAIEASIDPAEAESVRVDWSPEIFVDNSSTGTPEAENVALGPSGSLHWVLYLSRADGANFPEGAYKLKVAARDVVAALRDENGSRWGGEVLGDGGVIVRALTVKLPTGRLEIRDSHLLDASTAIRRGDNVGALGAYQLAAAADPTNQVIALRVALSLLVLKRYPEAIAAYEKLVGRVGLGELETARDLAHAYSGAGDSANARRVLRQAGLTEDRVDAELAEIRKRIR